MYQLGRLDGGQDFGQEQDQRAQQLVAGHADGSRDGLSVLYHPRAVAAPDFAIHDCEAEAYSACRPVPATSHPSVVRVERISA